MKIKKDNYIICTTKKWNINNFHKYYGNKSNFYLINDHKDLINRKIQQINPRYIFFPHWSWIIPKEIWNNYECVLFHMTDLPFGRGGSPLQNLILLNKINTKLSAIKVNAGIDAGDIYLKRDLLLSGSAQEIFENMSMIIYTDMIPYIIKYHPKPKPQTGKATIFKRRTPQQSEISNIRSIVKLYNFIRMLDADSYPRAYITKGKFIFNFKNAKKNNNKITAKVEIYEK